MTLGKVIYYILFFPVILVTGIYYIFLAVSFLMSMGVEVAQEFHKEIKSL